MTSQDSPSVGGDAIAVGNISGAQAVAIGRGAQAIVNINELTRSAQLEKHNRGVLLEKVQKFWIEEVFTRSLKSPGYILLDKETQFELVSTALDSMRQSTGQVRENVSLVGRDITSIFDEYNRSLLVLGRIGAGKTTAFMALTDTFIALAASDPAEPIPIILNLSSWHSRLTMAQWVIEQLHAVWGVPFTTSAAWLEEGALLLMLDGLDEVRDNERAACAAAINAFRGQYTSAPVAVSCREEVYRELHVRLNLDAAVRILPLNGAQVEQYLGGAYQTLREAIASDLDVAEIAARPLLLNALMALADTGRLADVLALPAGEKRRTFLLRGVQRRFETVIIENKRYHQKEVDRWLGWIATRMTEQNMSVFLLEKLDVLWLNSQLRMIYNVIFTGLGALVGLMLVYGESGLRRYLPAVAMAGLFYYASRAGHALPVESLGWSLAAVRANFKRTIGRAIVITSLISIVLSFAQLSAEELGNSGPFGLIVGSLCVGTLMGGILSIPLSGLRTARVSRTSEPNQSIRRSVRYSLVVAAGLTAFLTAALVVFGEGFFAVAVAIGISVGMGYGGFAATKHFVLRLLASIGGWLPLRMVRFLEFATEQGILLRMGGGYIFAHRNLQDHYARLNPKDDLVKADAPAPGMAGVTPTPLPSAARDSTISARGARMSVHVFALKSGKDLLDEITSRASNRGMEAAIITTCTGDLDGVSLRLPGSGSLTRLDGPHEIVALSGTLDAQGNSSLRLAVANRNGQVSGGFLAKGSKIGRSAEVVIGELEGMRFKHARDEKTGRDSLQML